MHLIKYYQLLNISKNFLWIILILVCSCGSSSKIHSSSTPTISQERKPVDKISTKTIVISENEREGSTQVIYKNQNLVESTLFSKYAELIEVPVSELTNAKLYNFINEWWNTPYKYAGNSRNGIDCSGFSCLLLKTVYNKEIIRGSAEMFKVTERVKKEDLKEGDLVFFKIRNGRISHVGVYLANNKFVHASVKYGVIISSLDHEYYKKVFASGGRLKE